MDQYLKLATGIIVLATAIVGFFKILLYKGSGSRKPKGQKSSGASNSLLREWFEPHIGLISVFSTMFIMVIAVYGFMFLVNKMVHVFDEPSKSTKQQEIRVSVPQIALDSLSEPEEIIYYKYLVATANTNEYTKNQILSEAVREAIAVGNVNLALMIVEEITNVQTHDKAVELIFDSEYEKNNIRACAEIIRYFQNEHKRQKASKKLSAKLTDMLKDVQ